MPHPNTGPQTSVTCEPLEPRQLLAATGSAHLAGGLVAVVGTKGDDQIVLSRTGDSGGARRLHVQVNGTEVGVFNYAKVKRILVHGGRGDDQILGGTIANHSWISTVPDRIPPMTLLGGAGDDNLEGSHNNDVLDGGIGNDSLHSGAGDDLLLGGPGNDTLFGDTGNDTLLGGAGDDLLDGNGDYRPPLPPGTTIDIGPAPGNGTWNDVIIGGRGADTFLKTDKPSEQKDVTSIDKLI